MAKLTIEDLKKIKETYRANQALREGGFRVKVTVHMGTCGIAAGARNIMTVLLDEIKASHLTDVAVTTSGCAGLCSKEPMITVETVGAPPVKYVALTDEKMRTIFREHVVGGTPVKDLALVAGHETSY